MNFKEYLEKNIVLFDGAMGTQIQSSGLPLGQSPETLNINNREQLEIIHRKYLKAGADVLSTNTFGASSYKLEEAGLDQEQVIVSAIKSASEAKFIALDLGPIGRMMKPIGDMTFDEAYDYYKEQVIHSCGADLVLVETMSDLNEVRAAVLAIKENSDLPVVVSMTFQEDGRTLTGVTPESFVYAVEALGVEGLGVNCSLGPNLLLPIVEDICKLSSTPVIVQANAGLPEIVDGRTTFNITPEAYSNYIQKFLDLGVRMIGGCCGTTPQHIQALNFIKEYPIKALNKKVKSMVSSSRKSVKFNDFITIGERINPTGNKKLKQSLLSGSIDACIREGIEQSSYCDVLDINVGLPDVNELEVMKSVVDELSGIVDNPLQIDSSKSKVLEAGLRRFPGVGIVNSVSGKQKSMDRIFPIVKKYGAMVICLTLDEDGIPKSAEKRVEIASKIIREAKKYGIAEEKLIIDCLVLTVSAQQAEVMETLKAIKIIKSKYKVKTTLGISNVSYGMPNRKLLTRTFMTLALSYGLDSAIMDPLDDSLRNTVLATKVLLNQDISGEKYIEGVRLKTVEVKKSELTFYDMVIKGYKEDVKAYTLDLLEKESPLKIVNEVLVATLDEVGLGFENKTIFLPQLIRAAETIGVAFDQVKLKLEKVSDLSKGKVLMATVRGDVHDIGKNLVKILLENYGFQVIDLGKDVEADSILQSVLQEDIKLVGLSALMTTTVISMEETIRLLKEKAPGTEIFVGGAVLTKAYAEKIGADYYCKDAKASVEVAQDVLVKSLS